MRLNLGQIFSLPDETRQHMFVALQYLKIYADEVKGVGEISEGPIQHASCNTTLIFTNDDLLLGQNLTIVLCS